jgi:large subunit ribosomal protein L4
MKKANLIYTNEIKTIKNTIGLIHRIYLIYRLNAYKHLAFTKTKGEVRGGGRKPHPQKGKGLARAGSIRSPLWVGGGVIFGPKPHLVSKKINKKEKCLGLLYAVSLKQKETFVINETLLVHESITKTSELLSFLKMLNITGSKKILIILSRAHKTLWKYARNLSNVNIVTANTLCTKHLIDSNCVLLSKKSLQILTQLHISNNYD